LIEQQKKTITVVIIVVNIISVSIIVNSSRCIFVATIIPIKLQRKEVGWVVIGVIAAQKKSDVYGFIEIQYLYLVTRYNYDEL